jgi:hypothetical protein
MSERRPYLDKRRTRRIKEDIEEGRREAGR